MHIQQRLYSNENEGTTIRNNISESHTYDIELKKSDIGVHIV